ncbi:hypothetical protein SA496_13705 [Pseudomonas sp. JS3066]|uniref:hypothetical protein n=1 Tax=unclassified Pseudomonas TaxID=196821 RepID=UPI002454B309|nr:MULTISPECIES: hypothetical protein [unclassified Pseudomonas]MDH4654896.1 hypothetical protein [Pseudomonas sp. BN606]WVK96163.1 hypothetical protein SA496_13705 [Pseudomonas sp. JS3066]
MKTVRMGMLALALSVTLATAWGADKVPMITGEQWTQSSPELKKAYLIGIANAFEVEAAYHATKPPSDEQSLIPRFGRGLKGHTLDTVRDGLDQWYAANPDRVKRPVIETIWFEMVVPGLQQNK